MRALDICQCCRNKINEYKSLTCFFDSGNAAVLGRTFSYLLILYHTFFILFHTFSYFLSILHTFFVVSYLCPFFLSFFHTISTVNTLSHAFLALIMLSQLSLTILNFKAKILIQKCYKYFAAIMKPV
jgi:hypothetical protein